MQPYIPLAPEQKEQTKHGEHFFPLEKYITELSNLYPSVPAHWHEEAEFTLITEGHCTYQVQFDHYEACAGDILFLSPAVLHSLSAAPDGYMKSETYVFHMNFLGANAADICAVRYLTPVAQQKLILPCIIHPDHPAYPDMKNIFSEMNRAYENKRPGFELKLKSLLLDTVASLLAYGREDAPRSGIEAEHMSKLRQVLEFIGEHYSEELTISRLAGMCYFSDYYFMRFFKKYVGTSCLEYIKNLRLEKAAGLFAHGETSVMEASLSAGFSNLSYFYREFRKKYGVTPTKYIESLSSGSVKPPHTPA